MLRIQSKRNTLAITLIVVAGLAMLVMAVRWCLRSPYKTGSFETRFSERSPLSDQKLVHSRLRFAGDAPEYNLADQPFLVYVPDSYSPEKPLGLVVLIPTDSVSDLPASILPQLAAANCALIVSKNRPLQWTNRAGLALDAVCNMQKLYAIDEKRVYAMGGWNDRMRPNIPGLIPEMLGLYFPEVFTGAICFGAATCFHADESGKAGFNYSPTFLGLSRSSARLASRHPFIFAANDSNDIGRDIVRSFVYHGFRYAKYQPVSQDQINYPNYATNWLPGMLSYLDDATASLPDAETALRESKKGPASQPAIDPPSPDDFCALSEAAACDKLMSLIAAGQQGDAEELADARLQAKPDDLHVAFLSACLTDSRFGEEEADSLFARVALKMPETPDGQCAAIVVALDRKHSVDTNFERLEKLVYDNPSDLMILWMLGKECRTFDRPGEGVGCFEQLCSKWNPGPTLVHQTYANQLTELKEYDAALPHRYLAVQMEPTFWTYHGLGLTQRGLKDFQAASDAFGKAARYAPNDAEYWFDWADALEKAHKLEEAKRPIQHACDLDPGNADYKALRDTINAEAP